MSFTGPGSTFPECISVPALSHFYDAQCYTPSCVIVLCVDQIYPECISVPGLNHFHDPPWAPSIMCNRSLCGSQAVVHTPLEGSKILPVLLLAATPADFFEGGLKLQSAEEDIIAYATGASLPVPQWLKLAGTAVSQFKRGHLILFNETWPNVIKMPCLARSVP